MASVCPNATSSAQANYAGPMPIIGLYIATATAVCFLLILFDVVSAIRQRKPWIPCWFFSLNSFTLTVMGVSTKLSVDLTTYMPGRYAQLSKLCSTVFICISMGFFIPSLGTMKGSNRYANLTSLTILVVTITVNVCMQISTGVIFSFVVEHIIIMIFMLILLWSCWSSSLDIDHILFSSVNYLKYSFQKSELSFGKISELDDCYLRSYIANPQVLMCEYSHCTTIGLLSSLSFTILLQATFRPTFFKEGISDYKWSIGVIVATQSLTCAVGCLSIIWRWISIAFHTEHSNFSVKIRGYDFSVWKRNTIWTSDWDIHFMALNHLSSGVLKCFLFLQSQLLFLRFGTQVISNFCDELGLFFIHICRKSFASAEPNHQLRNLNGYEYKKELREWLVRKSKDDLKRWKEKNQINQSNFPLLLSSFPSLLPTYYIPSPYPSNDQLEVMEDKCYQLVVVLRCAKVVSPLTVLHCLDSFDKAFEVICFVDKYMYSNSLEETLKLREAQDLWMTRYIDSGWFNKKIIKPALENYPNHLVEGNLECDLFAEMLNLASSSNFKPIGEEISHRAKELNRRHYHTNGLYAVINQFMLSIMHFYLSRFPTTIYQYIMDSSVDQIEARTKLAIKFYSKLQYLDPRICWQPLPMRPHGYVIDDNAVALSEVPAEVLTRDEIGDYATELLEVPVETTTEEITNLLLPI